MKEKEKRRGRGRRRREEEEEGEPSQRYGCLDFGMETHPDHESYVIMHEFPCFDGYNVAQI